MSDTSALQWIRQLSIAAGTDNAAIELSALHCTFRISAMTTTSPAVLIARIYNVSKQTAKFLSDLPLVPFGAANFEQPSPSAQVLLGQQGFSVPARVVIKAGYQGNFGTIFSGELIQVKQGRDTPADTWVDLVAGDGSGASALAVVNTSLAAGHKQDDVNKAIGQATAPYGVNAGALPSSLQQTQAPRGKVMFGYAQDHQELICRSNEMVSYTKQGTIVYWAPRSAYQAGQAVVVNARTGMIGLPTQTTFGVVVRMLLNPSVGIGTIIQINNASIQRQTFATDIGSSGANVGLDALNKYADASVDGTYYVFATEVVGDTRGTEWYTDAMCVASDATKKGSLLPTIPGQYMAGMNLVIPDN